MKNFKKTGLQAARLYGLAKVHKNSITLRECPSLGVLSIPGSQKFLSAFHEKLPILSLSGKMPEPIRGCQFGGRWAKSISGC